VRASPPQRPSPGAERDAERPQTAVGLRPGKGAEGNRRFPAFFVCFVFFFRRNALFATPQYNVTQKTRFVVREDLP